MAPLRKDLTAGFFVRLGGNQFLLICLLTERYVQSYNIFWSTPVFKNSRPMSQADQRIVDGNRISFKDAIRTNKNEDQGQTGDVPNYSMLQSSETGYGSSNGTSFMYITCATNESETSYRIQENKRSSILFIDARNERKSDRKIVNQLAEDNSQATKSIQTFAQWKTF